MVRRNQCLRLLRRTKRTASRLAHTKMMAKTPLVNVNKGEETSSIVRNERATHELARTKPLVKAFFAYAEVKYESKTQATRSPYGEVETNRIDNYSTKQTSPTAMVGDADYAMDQVELTQLGPASNDDYSTFDVNNTQISDIDNEDRVIGYTVRMPSKIGEDKLLTTANDAVTSTLGNGKSDIVAEISTLVSVIIPDEIDNIDELLSHFEGREEKLRDTLRGIYERDTLIGSNDVTQARDETQGEETETSPPAQDDGCTDADINYLYSTEMTLFMLQEHEAVMDNDIHSVRDQTFIYQKGEETVEDIDQISADDNNVGGVDVEVDTGSKDYVSMLSKSDDTILTKECDDDETATTTGISTDDNMLNSRLSHLPLHPLEHHPYIDPHMNNVTGVPLDEGLPTKKPSPNIRVYSTCHEDVSTPYAQEGHDIERGLTRGNVIPLVNVQDIGSTIVTGVTEEIKEIVNPTPPWKNRRILIYSCVACPLLTAFVALLCVFFVDLDIDQRIAVPTPVSVETTTPTPIPLTPSNLTLMPMTPTVTAVVITAPSSMPLTPPVSTLMSTKPSTADTTTNETTPVATSTTTPTSLPTTFSTSTTTAHISVATMNPSSITSWTSSPTFMPTTPSPADARTNSPTLSATLRPTIPPSATPMLLTSSIIFNPTKEPAASPSSSPTNESNKQSPTSSPSASCYPVEIIILYDAFPFGTGYAIAEANTVATSFSFFPSDDSLAYQYHSQSHCLEKGIYTFTIYDKKGDGLCCANGSGEYIITSNGVTLSQGGEFLFKEEVLFELPA